MRAWRCLGQTAVEYAVILTVVIAALITMQMYLKRSLSGQIRSAADSIGEQYAPTKTTVDMTTTVSSKTTTTSVLKKQQDIGDSKTGDVMETTTKVDAEKTTKTGSETVGALEGGL